MKKLIYLFSMLLLFSSCTSMIERWLGGDDYEEESPYLKHMPEKTMEGNNTFSCYINGKLLAVQGTKGKEGSDFVTAKRIESDNNFAIGWLPAYYLDISIEFEDKDMGHLCVRFDTTNLKEGINHCDMFCNKYAVNDSVDVNVTFLNEEKHIICGEFEKVILYDSENIKDVITLTKGQFDVKYELHEYNSKNR